ncbi:HIT family protein [Thalassobacillus sp. CUG 92003]|uniref:HIT family protein n=1 Tax=Thalassobacillus sp. CUG 92003 TaxID=2736641 RepID=UPI0015E6E083|nr:HIT domain-containing protein [Thalassobacillus sp. CUG 92003]
MGQDFYCEEVLSGNIEVDKFYETASTLAYYHTRPFYEVHIVAIPKVHIPSFTTVEAKHKNTLDELVETVQHVASTIEAEYGACRVMTNLGAYQESKHLHWHIVHGEKIK